MRQINVASSEQVECVFRHSKGCMGGAVIPSRRAALELTTNSRRVGTLPPGFNGNNCRWQMLRKRRAESVAPWVNLVRPHEEEGTIISPVKNRFIVAMALHHDANHGIGPRHTELGKVLLS